MSSIIAFEGKTPVIPRDAFLAPGAHVIGDVVIGSASSVWFNAVIRGDVQPVRIGSRTNIQDNATLHVSTDGGPLTVGSDVTIGHSVIVHGCSIGDRCLIGMGAILLDGVTVGAECLIGAGSFLREGMEVPEGMLVVGHPAAIKRSLSHDERSLLAKTAERYVRHAEKYRNPT